MEQFCSLWNVSKGLYLVYVSVPLYSSHYWLEKKKMFVGDEFHKTKCFSCQVPLIWLMQHFPDIYSFISAHFHMQISIRSQHRNIFNWPEINMQKMVQCLNVWLFLFTFQLRKLQITKFCQAVFVRSRITFFPVRGFLICSEP